MTQFEIYSLIIAGIGVGAAIAAAAVGIKQLGSLAESAKLSILANVIDIENAMHERRKDLSNVATEVLNASKNPSPDSFDIEILKKKNNEAIESYLNAVDRLCASILRGLIPADEAQRDYRNLVNDLMVGEIYKPFFHAGTPYRNITALHNKWNPSG